MRKDKDKIIWTYYELVLFEVFEERDNSFIGYIGNILPDASNADELGR